jgi:hypothetical protein
MPLLLIRIVVGLELYPARAVRRGFIVGGIFIWLHLAQLQSGRSYHPGDPVL